MSDHISGPRALADPIADITDLYAFPSPAATAEPRAGDEHAAVRAAGRRVLRRADLSVQAASADPCRAQRPPGAVRRRRRRARLRLRLLRSGRQRMDAARAAGHLHAHRRGNGVLPGRRPGRRCRTRDPGVRRCALGPVHHGRAGGAEDDRDPEAGLHRPRRDLPRRQERPQPRASRSTPSCWAAPRWSGWSPRRSPADASTSGSNASGGRRSRT